MRGADPNQAAALSVQALPLARALSLLEGDTRRENRRKGGTRWSLHNLKHGVGGGFV